VGVKRVAGQVDRATDLTFGWHDQMVSSALLTHVWPAEPTWVAW